MHDVYYKKILLLGICVCHAYYMLEYALLYTQKKFMCKKRIEISQ